MRIRYELSQRDFVSAMFAHTYRHPAYRLSRYLMVVIVVLIGLRIGFPGGGGVALVTLPIVVMYLFILWAAPYFRGRQQYASQPATRGTQTLEFTATEVRTEGPLSSSNLRWESFVRWYEGTEVVLLYQSDLAFLPIPKRALTSEELVELRRTLDYNIGKGRAAAANHP